LAARPARPTLTARGLDAWRPLETLTGQTVWIGRALEPPTAGGAAPAVLAADMQDLLPLWDRARLFTAGRDGRSNPEAAMPLALTPLRALLVLERPQDYAAAGIEAPASGDTGRLAAEADQPPAKQGQEAVVSQSPGGWLGRDWGSPAMATIGTGGGGTAEGTIGRGALADRGRGAGYENQRRNESKTGRKIAALRPLPLPRVLAAAPAGEPDADLPATEALAMLDGLAPLPDRVAQVAGRLSLDGVSDPESLAWTLDRHAASRNRIILIARLLVAAERLPDAIRVLSEHAPFDREAIGAEMRRLGADADAAELLSLAERSP
jgi:hypothetical protein